MTVESATYLSQLDATLPGSSDAKSEGDNHLRLIKSVLKATFPNVSGAVTPTHTQLNQLATVSTLAVGTYTPVASNTSNCSVSSPTTRSYIRIGNVVLVLVSFNITVTGTGHVGFDFTLPVATANASPWGGSYPARPASEGAGYFDKQSVAGSGSPVTSGSVSFRADFSGDHYIDGFFMYTVS